MYVVGIDPGRDKCGVAVLNSDGEIFFEKVIETVNFEETLKNLFAQYNFEVAILGDGTTHKNAEKILRSLNIEVKIVDEKHTTEEARRLYWKKNPPRGWRNHLPHDGRHTCATLMDDAEISLKIRQLILGHSSQDITSRVYTHKTIRQLIDAIDKI